MNDNGDKDVHVKKTEQYCTCGKPANDDMVKCENPNCRYMWFHYECVGIKNPDALPEKWYCPECEVELKQ